MHVYAKQTYNIVDLSERFGWIVLRSFDFCCWLNDNSIWLKVLRRAIFILKKMNGRVYPAIVLQADFNRFLLTPSVETPTIAAVSPIF